MSGELFSYSLHLAHCFVYYRVVINIIGWFACQWIWYKKEKQWTTKFQFRQLSMANRIDLLAVTLFFFRLD